MAELITGLFQTRAEAERAVNDLTSLGYSQSDISVVINDGTRAREFADATGLVGAGIPEDRARQYETGLNDGGILVGVNARPDQTDEVRRVLERDGADDIQDDGTFRGNTAAQTDFLNTAPAVTPDPGYSSTVTDATAATPATGYMDRNVTDDAQTIQLREEELTARKQQVEAGEVRLHKEVVTETKNIEVPVTREEVVIERRPAGAVAATDAQFTNGDETIRIPVMEEQVTVQKTPVVTEEVTVGKRQVTENRQFTDTVQREEARIDSTAGARITGDPVSHTDEMLDEDVTEREVANAERKTW
jgi:uncharacterized protein (TIGR02271 family)